MKKLLIACMAVCALSACTQTKQVPLSFNVENRGADAKLPQILPVEQLPSVAKLPDPFAWSDGSGRCKTFKEWTRRRTEIIHEIGSYELGLRPPRPADMTATYSNGVLEVVIKDNGQTLTLSSPVTMPKGEGPFPVIIGMNRPTGTMAAELFEDFIQIPYLHNQTAIYGYGVPEKEGPFFQMYPHLKEAGDYCAWSWGISRLIDGLEMVQSQLNADMSRIGITGCSYAGKMTLFGAAFDERIALAIVQESGGGGVNAWRVSETIGEVEKISNTNYSWFMKRLRNDFDGKADRLPYDHHELIALIAPRAVLVLGNPDFQWLGDPSGYVATEAAMEVWKAMGVEDRIGYDFSPGHPHCRVNDSQHAAVVAFVDKFLRGDTETNTLIRNTPVETIDPAEWISEWAGYQLKMN
ncbi:hypothetical protein M2137_003076 [Parabacteroides sp. PFB2-10]|uniref:alpha/beta hydrolase family protein n=1 Tax=Parabacteroides sp. PFB2-10 TaxID=1742405 RepID=UPI0024772780|nr:hypothetical protein [Parabacteroides sp. PFB2-10]MDH6314276.1 hypothetical protein [Parabacteroides sp. PFB2-10]MDL2245508.1 hypothetical protein [Parabacteroides sp. OttesenSCG-928-J18]